MDMPRLTKSVRRVTVLQRDASGALAPVVVFERRRSKKKKSSQMFEPVEKLTRSFAEAANAANGSYLTHHKRSNRKRRDGWMRDAPSNVLRASRKAAKEIRPAQFFGL